MQLRKLNVGCFGGGTGLPSLLGGLKTNPWLALTAVVTMFDSGGSSGQLRDDEWANLVRVCSQMHDLYFYLDDTPSLSPLDLRVKARRIYQEFGLDLIIVDYLQLMQGESASRNENRVAEISYISRMLKQIARELRVPLIAGSQLSRVE